MCGINAVIGFDQTKATTLVREMNIRLHQRGPEGTGIWADEYVCLGHTRLRISDLSEPAAQPFASPDGRFQLVFNGEIYNCTDLKLSLEPFNIQYLTHSDTEVLLWCLIHFGIKALEHLNGMFAFVFYDSSKKTAIIARDRFGIKPLYYRTKDNFWIISSELQAIKNLDHSITQINLSLIPHYLLNRYAPKPETFYTDFIEVEPGNILQLDIQANRPVWHKFGSKSKLGLSEPKYKQDKLIYQTERLILDAAENQLKAAVPIGLMLSGGTDSTLLASIMAELGYKNAPSYTISWLENGKISSKSDAWFAEKAAKQYGLEANLLEISPKILEHLPEMVAGLDQPIADPAALLTWYLCKEAKKSVKVLLSGAGADELFGGYNRHWAFYQWLKLNPYFPNWLLKAKGALMPFISYFKGEGSQEYHVINSLEPDPKETFIRFSQLPGFIPSMFVNSPQRCKSSLGFERLPENDLIQWALKWDRDNYLVSDILALTDKCAMKHSVEVRVPFLDNDLVNFALSISNQLLFRKGRKWILGEILKKRGGEVFVNRPKQGFGMPLANWLRLPFSKKWIEIALNPKLPTWEYIHRDKTMLLVKSHLNSDCDFSREIWALIVLAIWLEKERF